jgi:hypothetical protein
LSVRVSGNHFVNGAGRTIRLLGVNGSTGSAYMCVSAYGLVDGSDATAAAIASWHANTVRINLNEDCWLNINGVPAGYGGANYVNAVVNQVNLLHRHNLYVILDLHWNAPGAQLATGQLPMADADHSPAFWRSVATTFKNDPAVVFDLYNEPYGIDWNCWLNGCNSPGYQTAGMQSLVNAVRSTGATQPIMVGGLDWADDLTQWLAYRPTDPNGQLVASSHVYPNDACNYAACWNSVFAPIAAQVPMVTGETGSEDFPCTANFVATYLPWADAHGISYTPWVWEPWGCGPGQFNALLDTNGNPTAYGAWVKAHLMAVN